MPQRKQLAAPLLACLSPLLLHLLTGSDLIGVTAVRHDATSKTSRIIVADDASYAPFVFFDAAGKPTAIIINIWKLWSSKTGIPVEFLISPNGMRRLTQS